MNDHTQAHALLGAFLDYIHYERQLADSTRRTYHRILSAHIDALTQPLTTMNSAILQQQLSEAHKRLSPKTLVQHRAALRGFYSWLTTQGHISHDPTLSLRLPKRRQTALPKALSPDDMNRLLQAPNTDDPITLRDHAILECFYSSGLRLAELAALNTDASQQAHLRVRGKGNKERLVFIGQAAQSALQRWMLVRAHLLHHAAAEVALFVSKQGKRLSHRGIQLAISRYAATRLPGRNIHPHMLRHSFASHVLQSSQNIRAVQDMLGHSNLSSTQIYTHLDYQHLSQAYDQSHPRARKDNKTTKK